MRIRKLNLKNIGPFEDTEIEFKPSDGTQEIHILTGPNGSGKTTLLHALAAFFGAPSPNITALLKRMRPDDSSEIRVEVEDEAEATSQVVNRSTIGASRRSDPWPGGDWTFSLNILDLPTIAAKKGERWLAFAYSGYRVLQAIQVNAIQELPPGFATIIAQESLVFDKKISDPALTLNQWIANSISKRALAKEKNKKTEAERYAAAMGIIETIISKMVGYDIKFDLQTSPLSLVAQANNADLSFDVLPEGLRSIISWIGDLLMRLEILSQGDTVPLNEQRIFLFLDEIDVHLHPAWQRNILPVVKEFFPNATIFLTTHSPFVVNSVDGAWVYELKVKDGKAYLGEVRLSKSGESYEHVLRDVFDIETRFGGETQKDLDLFQQRKNEILQGKTVDESAFLTLAQHLATQSLELQSIIQFELRQLNRIKGKSYEL